MRRGGLWAAVAVVFTLSCAGAAPSVGASAAPDANVGYIAGAFSNQGTRGFALGFALFGPDGKELVLAFDGPMAAGTVSATRLALIAVPPGEYQVQDWIAFSALGQKLSRSAVDGSLSEPFVVKSGQVVFLGRFGARTTGFSKVTFSVHAEKTSGADALAMLRSGYPRFSETPVACVLCSSPVPGPGTTASPPAPVRDRVATPVAAPVSDPVATPAAAPERTAPPAKAPSPRSAALPSTGAPRPGTVVLHLHRPDGDYAGWGLTTWETTEAGKPRRMISSLAEPLAGAGVDAYGAYWVLRESDYGDRRVGFLLRKGEAARLCGAGSGVVPLGVPADLAQRRRSGGVLPARDGDRRAPEVITPGTGMGRRSRRGPLPAPIR